MEGRQYGEPLRIGRRRLLVGTGAAAAAAVVVGSVGTVGLVRPASATELRRAKPAPSPIPGGVVVGLDPPLDFIHIYQPGPVGSFTPFLGLPGEGLDVEPSTITNFKGFTVDAILSGQAEGSDGKIYNVEVDLRVMEGEYIAADGSHQQGAFGLF
jgi:hypothetical protein